MLRPTLLPLLLLVACQAPLTGGETPTDGGAPTLAAALEGLESRDGFVGVAHDPADGRLLLTLTDGAPEFLWVVALTSGLGSNDVGLDRGQLSRQTVLTTRRAGDRLELVAPNLDYRTASGDPALERAGREAFAEGVVASLEIVAEGDDGALLVDATEFVHADAHGVARSLSRTGQGSFRLDRERSRVLADGFAALPDNSYVDLQQTFASDSPGGEVRSTAADPNSVTLRVRHHFVRLPEDPLATRHADPRSGYFTTSWRQLDAAPDAPDRVDVVNRHRLPADGSPIVYHLDPGAPEPMRSALLEGARYWEQAFAEAGLPGRFRVELLPEGADIHDVRFNTIQWVFRSTRGWSYGNSIVDPRTGEILKGHVTLGALRVRQDVRLIEGLLAPYGESDSDPRVMEAALSRLRQLAAHEVGHTLGLRHHFAASTVGRASVMDYPPPRVVLDGDGRVDVSGAYRPSAGEWDALAIEYGYADFEGDERAALEGVIERIDAAGLALLSDADASAGIHPRAHRWDDGVDAAQALVDSLAVRRAALDTFGQNALRRGRALSDLELTLVPLYFHHRYQVDAAVALVGGREYEHAVRGDDEPPRVRPVAADRQRAALAALLDAISPQALRMPDEALELLAPPAPGSPRDRERFQQGADLVDPLHAARAAAAAVLRPLLDRDRLTRVAQQHEAGQLTLRELMDRLRIWGWRTADADPAAGVLRREARAVLLELWLDLLADPNVSPTVQQEIAASFDLYEGEGRRSTRLGLDERESWELWRFLDNPSEQRAAATSFRIPPGPPIGCGYEHGPLCAH